MFLFIGITLTTLWLPSLSDIYGRKLFYAATMGAGLAIHLGMFFAQSWTLMIVLSFIFGLITPLRLQVGYNYLIEFWPKRSQINAGMIYLVLDASVFMITTLYFWKISIYWKPYFIVLICINIFAFVGSLILPESPRILVSLGKNDEAFESLNVIARVNCKRSNLHEGLNTSNSSLLINSMETSMSRSHDRSTFVLETLN